MKKIVFIALAALLVSACATKPIQNVENHPIPAASQQLPLDRIEALIIAAGQVRSWKFQQQAPGHLVATQTQDVYSASVDIRFDQRAYAITYRSSEGMREKDGIINSRYNLWVRLLQRDIDRRLGGGTVAAQ